MEQQNQKPTNSAEMVEYLKSLGMTVDFDGKVNIPAYFKFKKEFADRLISYLDQRPMVEVEILANTIERCTEDKDEAMDYEAITEIVRYLQEKCPRGEVKNFVKEMMMENGAVITYIIKEEKKEEIEGSITEIEE